METEKLEKASIPSVQMCWQMRKCSRAIWVWCNSLGWLPMAPIQMAEVQKCAPAVTADGADADPALLPIAGRTHAQITLLTVLTHRAHFTCTAHICTDHITHHVLFTWTVHIAYSQTTGHCSHAQMQRPDNSQCTVHTLYSYAQLIIYSSHVQTDHTAQSTMVIIADIVHHMNCPLLKMETAFLNAVLLGEMSIYKFHTAQTRKCTKRTLQDYFEGRSLRCSRRTSFLLKLDPIQSIHLQILSALWCYIHLWSVLVGSFWKCGFQVWRYSKNWLDRSDATNAAKGDH